MKFEVIVEKWGVYSKGDVIEMHPTTGKACKKVVKVYKEKAKKSK